MTTEAIITPALLRWARERDRVSPENVARQVSVDTARLLSWESGDTRPTVRQALRLARALHVPFGCLYLSEPPQERLALPDLRIAANGERRQPSAALRDVVNRVLTKQEWYRELQAGEGATRLPFIGRHSLQTGCTAIAADIRDTVGMGADLLDRVVSAVEYLQILIERTEVLGIPVLQSGVVEPHTHRTLDVEELRGIVISDNFAPLIFLNSNVATPAQIFTLLHALAHLWIGESGIDSPELQAPASATLSEWLCNHVAAEVLVPADTLRMTWSATQEYGSNVEKASKRFKVGTDVVLYRAHDAELIPEAAYLDLVGPSKEASSAEASRSHAEVHDETVYTQNGRVLTNITLTALAEGRVLYMDAARALDIHAGDVSKLLNERMRD